MRLSAHRAKLDCLRRDLMVRGERRKNCESEREGFRVGDRSRGRFATPADFPPHDCSPYSPVHVQQSLGFVPRSRAIICRAPCQTLALRFATASLYTERFRPTRRKRVGLPTRGNPKTLSCSSPWCGTLGFLPSSGPQPLTPSQNLPCRWATRSWASG
jgi:hypothetical protein